MKRLFIQISRLCLALITSSPLMGNAAEIGDSLNERIDSSMVYSPIISTRETTSPEALLDELHNFKLKGVPAPGEFRALSVDKGAEASQEPHWIPSASLALSATHTDNAFRIENDRDSDTFAGLTFTIGAQKKLKSGLGLAVGGALYSEQYDDFELLGYNMYVTTLQITKPVGRFVFIAAYTPRLVFDHDFTDHVLTRHDLSAQSQISIRTWNDGAVSLNANPTFLRVFADKRSSEFTRLELPLALANTFDEKHLEIKAEFKIRHDWYDDFNEVTLMDSREDFYFIVGGSAVYTPNNWLSIAAAVEYTDRNSTTADDYHQLNITPSVKLIASF